MKHAVINTENDGKVPVTAYQSVTGNVVIGYELPGQDPGIVATMSPLQAAILGLMLISAADAAAKSICDELSEVHFP